ncbi:MAG: hypothetical protein WC813_04415 [Patescibacteria group bacterium]
MTRLLAIVTTTGLSQAGGNAGYTVSQTLPQLIGVIISAVFGILGVVFLILVVYAGFIWMTSAGNSKLVDRAKGMLISATVGLVITLSAFAISSFIINALQQSQSATSDSSYSGSLSPTSTPGCIPPNC